MWIRCSEWQPTHVSQVRWVRASTCESGVVSESLHMWVSCSEWEPNTWTAHACGCVKYPPLRGIHCKPDPFLSGENLLRYMLNPVPHYESTLPLSLRAWWPCTWHGFFVLNRQGRSCQGWSGQARPGQNSCGPEVKQPASWCWTLCAMLMCHIWNDRTFKHTGAPPDHTPHSCPSLPTSLPPEGGTILLKNKQTCK